MPPTIPTPLRILLLSTPNTSIPTLFQDTETHQILTPYYSASIPLWRDTLPLPPSLSAWSTEWHHPEAGEVIAAIGAWIVCFRAPATRDELGNIRDMLQTIHGVIMHHTLSSYDAPEPLLVAVGMPDSATPALEIGEDGWEDLGRECGGWEYIDGGIPLSSSSGEGREGGEKGKRKGEGQTNEYGEKVGMDRLVEALEANEWESGAGGGGLDEFDDGGGGEMEGDSGEEQGLEGELGFVAGDAQEGTELREGLLDGEDGGGDGADAGGEEDVMALESMMLKMQAVKEMGADMPEAERRRFAAKTVREVMKNI